MRQERLKPLRLEEKELKDDLGNSRDCYLGTIYLGELEARGERQKFEEATAGWEEQRAR